MALSGRKEDLVLCQIYLTSYREFIPKFNLKHHHRNKQLLVRAYIYIYIYMISMSVLLFTNDRLVQIQYERSSTITPFLSTCSVVQNVLFD
jgi:hypothetical protein